MPGIEAGEIGPKVHGAMSAVDNGWARFTDVRVPRAHMLARFARVERDPDGRGVYVQPPHSKLSFGGMVYIRAQMIGSLAWQLARAATISTRYLHMRRQFKAPESADQQTTAREAGGRPQEQQVIRYPSVYMRVIPQIVDAIVFITAGKEMVSLEYGFPTVRGADALIAFRAGHLVREHVDSARDRRYDPSRRDARDLVRPEDVRLEPRRRGRRDRPPRDGRPRVPRFDGDREDLRERVAEYDVRGGQLVRPGARSSACLARED